MYGIRNTGQFTCSKCKVAILLWFAHICTRSHGDAQLLSWSYLVNHTRIPLIFWVNLIGMRYSQGMKHGIFFYITSLHYHNLKITMVIHARFPLVVYLQCFKVMWTNPILIPKLVHKSSTINIEWNALKTTLP